MGTIPASKFVQVTPGVIGAGGTGLLMIGLMLDNGTRVPLGQVLSFPSAAGINSYFGAASVQAAEAAVYFAGFTNSPIKPSAMLVAQFNQQAVPAWLRGGNAGTMTLQQLQALSGSLSVTVDGVVRNAGGINLSGASSFSAAAGIIQTALNAATPAGTQLTGSIAYSSASFTGSISGSVLTVSTVASGTLAIGATMGTAGGVAAGTIIQGQLSGTPGGAGTYAVSNSQAVAAQAGLTAAYSTLTATAITSGTLAPGQTVAGSGVGASDIITQQLSGTAGSVGTYALTGTGAVVSEPLTASGTPVVVTYDSTSGGFLITSGAGIAGASSTISYATGTLATPLFLTQAAGAVASQGGAPQTPAAFMAALTLVTTNWASFWTDFDPDGGFSNQLKLAFANWNGLENNEFLYVPEDTDITPTESTNATASLGNILKANATSGTAPIYLPSELYHAAFVCGSIASIDFTRQNGRTTLAYRSQSGLVPGVTNETVSNNLDANGYNYYCAVATASEQFQFFYSGLVSGEFLWIDSYVNQIWMNAGLQQAILTLFTQAPSISYNPAGYSLIAAACQTVINAALNFGAIRQNVPLSPLQAAEVNAAAGVAIDGILSTQGWYLQILPASAQVRAARQSPPVTLWYMDGQSVQQINLFNEEVA